jgi:hypothetical protein
LHRDVVFVAARIFLVWIGRTAHTFEPNFDWTVEKEFIFEIYFLFERKGAEKGVDLSRKVLVKYLAIVQLET